MKRTLYIGDVHGCLRELEEMLDQFAFVKGTDEIYLTGDLINKGPDSAGVLRLVLQNHFLAVLGNHEARLLQIMHTPSELWTDKEKKMAAVLGEPEWIATKVAAFPLWLDTPHALLVHAGLEPGKTTLETMDSNVLLSIRTWDGLGKNLDNVRNPPWYECVEWPKPVVFGHWAMQGLVDLPRFKGLDSGCVYGKSLSGWCPEENRFYSVPAKAVYTEVNKKKQVYIATLKT